MRIVNHELMREDEPQRYFHQLINIVDYCHSEGVSHRDLKDNGLLHTAYGTSNYIALECFIGFENMNMVLEREPRERRDRERKPLKLLHPMVDVGDLGLIRFL
ncbi:hypothetical protein POTOM_047204 [Populus tomentosa]|uniref:Protein kinase domain-containing protein n=1 Tax=Populus tomentosa TaxID=118781 RepID=A0A8X7YKI8_POPTO|nr:hypothetical protein POTOM_047204 [Populus tomentosa]